jgi:hypothetical protein
MEHSTRRWLAVLLIVIAILAPIGGAIIVQELGNSIASSSGLNGNTTLAQEYGYVDAYNGTWHTIAVTTTTAGGITFTAPWNTSLIYVFSDNPAHDVQQLLGNTTSFVTASVAISDASGTSGTANLTSLEAVMGGIHNSTSDSSLGDHGITHASASLNLYNSTQSLNDLGKAEQFQIFSMMSGNLKNEMQLQIHLSGWKGNLTGVHDGASVTVTTTQQYAVKINILDDTGYVMLLFFILGLALAVLAIPRVTGLGQFRVRKNEAYGLVAAIVVFGVSYGILDLLGTTYSYIGIGLPYAALFGFAMGMYLYGTLERVGSFAEGVGYGTVGLLGTGVVTEFLPFLNPLANLSTVNLVGLITAVVFDVTMFVLAAAGIVSVKNSRFD